MLNKTKELEQPPQHFVDSAMTTTKDMSFSMAQNYPIQSHRPDEHNQYDGQSIYQNQRVQPQMNHGAYHRQPSPEADLEQWQQVESFPYEITNDAEGTLVGGHCDTDLYW